ncbi:hypothetical protein PFISCL1PPCAC_13573 [Pristionchus fissidentatus]|uniref:CHK kinase-like domain-containing protein n=1 Tax=Pristionchus fissidentatus TaxID=1538716 RepID=A0AAV5VRQ3_9BILA|nr:hypothetical protein PFISCL1PPCAC_13573 [Pristionchus fissidentatus]
MSLHAGSRAVERFPNHSDNLNLIVKNVISDPEWWIKNEKKFENPDVVSVLVHGDMWSPQFLWKNDDLLSLVDWQQAHIGSLTEDLLHVLSLCISVEMKERVTVPLLRYYYNQLTAAMKAKNTEVPFTFDYLQQDYRDSLPLTACFAIIAISMWSNSPVLRSGTSDDEERVAEAGRRMLATLNHCVKECGWS